MVYFGVYSLSIVFPSVVIGLLCICRESMHRQFYMKQNRLFLSPSSCVLLLFNSFALSHSVILYIIFDMALGENCSCLFLCFKIVFKTIHF